MLDINIFYKNYILLENIYSNIWKWNSINNIINTFTQWWCFDFAYYTNKINNIWKVRLILGIDNQDEWNIFTLIHSYIEIKEWLYFDVTGYFNKNTLNNWINKWKYSDKSKTILEFDDFIDIELGAKYNWTSIDFDYIYQNLEYFDEYNIYWNFFNFESFEINNQFWNKLYNK